jgi:hypothetical protein
MSTSKPMQPTGPRNPIAKWIHPSFTNLGNLKPELPNGEKVPTSATSTAPTLLLLAR